MSIPVHAGPGGEITCVRGEAFTVSGVTGDIEPGGAHGVYARDIRLIDRLEIHVNGRSPSPLSGVSTGAARASFHSHVPVTAGGPDPVLHVDRRRVVDGSLHEDVRVTNHGRVEREVELGVTVGTDFAYIFDVRHGRPLPRVEPEQEKAGLRFRRATGDVESTVRLSPPPDEVDHNRLLVRRTLAPGQDVTVCLEVRGRDVYGDIRPRSGCEALDELPDPVTAAGPPGLTVHCADRRFEALVETSFRDLAALTLVDPEDPDDRFCAAGSPWYLTLFGRDSLWAARMALPFDLELARGTLRALARRQGRRDDPSTEEEPGKILHEIRRGSLTHRGDLPPTYYGSIDATPLFVMLAHDAWRAGMSHEDLAPLLDPIRAAMVWMVERGDADGDGFLEYERHGERGLDNQGWKDSHDGIQYRDATLARAPVALAEVQAYAYEALLGGASMLEALASEDVASWRGHAERLREAFRRSYWVEDELGRYPGCALDADKRLVDGPTSNMGHLLGTGLLEPDEVDDVERQLADPRLSSGWGLRTMSSTSAGYNPLGYHTGSVWPHDTAIAVWGLTAEGRGDTAAALLDGLLDAAEDFDERLPELFGGHDRRQAVSPVPYPAACRPQAWAAGAGVLLLRSCLGLHPDVPAGVIRLRPMWPPPFRLLEVTGLRIGDATIWVRIDARRGVDVEVLEGDLAVEVHGVPTTGPVLGTERTHPSDPVP